ncbi:MAG: hypothetical protein ABFD79_10990 [Phycisphaerales bacterium]
MKIKSSYQSYSLLILVLFLFCGSAPGAENKSEPAKIKNTISEEKIAEALENGNSLVLANVKSAYSVEGEGRKRRIDYYYYTIKMKSVIAGDLAEKDFEDPIEISAGSYKGNPLNPGATYAIFISKQSLNGFYWVYKEDFAQVTKENIKTLQETAKNIYAKTDIAKFRETAKMKIAPADVSEEISKLCQQFRDNPENRAKYGREIWESQLGSRKERTENNEIKYSKPEIVLTREQILSLLGEPSLKYGWTYKWFCGQEEIPGMNNQAAILTVVFDKKFQVAYLVYSHEDRLKWVK